LVILDEKWLLNMSEKGNTTFKPDNIDKSKAADCRIQGNTEAPVP